MEWMSASESLGVKEGTRLGSAAQRTAIFWRVGVRRR